MQVAPLNQNKGSEQGALAAPLKAATTALTSLVALKWSSSSLKAGELPPELLKNKAHLAIFLLPRAFDSLNCYMASEFAELWQFGRSKKRAVELVKQAYPDPSLSICRFKLSEFATSETIKAEIRAILDRSFSALPEMALEDRSADERWRGLRTVAKAVAARYKNKNQWSETTPNFQSTLLNPSVLLEARAVRTDSYIGYGESPIKSDAYGAIGPFAARSYLRCVISKKPGDYKIYIKPLLVGARIWDNYDFKDFDGPDSTMANLLSKILVSIMSQFLGVQKIGNTDSQFLGFWKELDEELPMILRNADFQSFRDHFRPVYNRQTPAPPRLLVCQDFSPVSDYSIRAVEGGAEYPLAGLKAQ